LALSGALYSRIALSFALNRIFFLANENGTVKQNSQSDILKLFKTNQSHCRKMKDKKAVVWQIKQTNKVCDFKMDLIKWRSFNFEITRMSIISDQIALHSVQLPL